MNYRIGHGYDVHRFADGRKLILGGVEIPYVKGLLGHSDADVLLHAICDAILGALALGDIGKHFPDTDPKYKGADSLKLLSHCHALISARGYDVVNVDSTIVLERPKIAHYVPEMQKNIAAALKIMMDDVSIKATTSEGMGFIGIGEGAVAHAIVLLKK